MMHARLLARERSPTPALAPSPPLAKDTFGFHGLHFRASKVNRLFNHRRLFDIERCAAVGAPARELHT
jgi:hypothetical protein